METETPIQTAGKTAIGALRALLILIGVAIMALAVVWFFHHVPDTDMELTSVSRDTTFYIGRAESNGGRGGYISLLATGELDDSTASILIDYTKPPAGVGELQLSRGKINQLYTSDFYDAKARVTYRHGRVKQGNLRLQIVFSLPPGKWGYTLKNGHWTRAK
ncbi:hypothetical protein BH09BAC4_BH09BAC4_03440 [soil metagenome]